MKTLTALLLLISSHLLAQRHSFSIKEIKDTIDKYEIFDAYEKLSSKKVPYDSIRNNAEIKKEFLKLLDIDNLKTFYIQKERKKIINELQQKDFDTLSFINNYIDYSFFERKIHNKIRDKIKDSIKINKELYKTYLDSAIINKNTYALDQIEKQCYYINHRIIDFLLPTQWQEVINYTKSLCHNHESFGEPFCKNRLINMNDADTIKNYEKYFTEKLNSGKLHYDDYIFIKKFYYNTSFLLKLYIHILHTKQQYEIDPFEGYIKPIRNLKYIKRYHQALKGTAFDDIISLLNLEKEDFLIDENTPNYEKLLLYLKVK